MLLTQVTKNQGVAEKRTKRRRKTLRHRNQAISLSHKTMAVDFCVTNYGCLFFPLCSFHSSKLYIMAIHYFYNCKKKSISITF